jgi:protein-disulfide isomerase
VDRPDQPDSTLPEAEKPARPDVFIEQHPPVSALPVAAEPQTVRREVFNYLVIAVVFALVGGFAGYMLASSSRTSAEIDTQALAGEVALALRPMLDDVVAAARPPNLEDPSSRFNVSADERRVWGPDDAAVVIVEFSDFNCSFCGRFANETLQPLMDTYGDRVRFTYRDYPILAESSLTAALAGHCAAEQGNFWEYHNILFANPGNFSRDNLVTFAGRLRLDTAEFSACMDEERYLDTVIADYRAAQSLGLRGTPAFFINGRPISGAQPYQVFAGIIEEELAAAEANGSGAS